MTETAHFKTTPNIIGKRILDFQNGTKVDYIKPTLTAMDGLRGLITVYSKDVKFDEADGPKNAYSILEKIVTYRPEAERATAENIDEVMALLDINSFRSYAFSTLLENPSFSEGVFEKILADEDAVRKLLNLAIDSDLKTMESGNKKNVGIAELQVPEEVFEQFRKFKEDLNEQESTPPGNALA